MKNNRSQLMNNIPNTALQALLYEATLGPKPGLVDRFDNGAHNDMDIFTFIDSSTALAPYFRDYFEAGIKHNGNPRKLFQKIRQIGIEAENTMLATTGNINTHKGANFSFAIFLAALGKKYDHKTVLNDVFWEDLSSYICQMCENLSLKDLSKLNEKETLTHGEQIYLTHGITGIRSDAEKGYPTLFKEILPFIRSISYREKEEILLLSLLLLMSITEDTNVIKRSSLSEWQLYKMKSEKLFHTLIDKPLSIITQELQLFNLQLIEKNISPGGAADMLALTIFLAKLEHLI